MAPIPPEQVWRSAGEGTRVHVRLRMHPRVGTRELGLRSRRPEGARKAWSPRPRAETRSHLRSELWQRCLDEYRKENDGHRYKTMRITSGKRSANPEGTAVTNRSCKLPFLREGLPRDRMFWRISPRLKRWYHTRHLSCCQGHRAGVSLRDPIHRGLPLACVAIRQGK